VHSGDPLARALLGPLGPSGAVQVPRILKVGRSTLPDPERSDLRCRVRWR